MIILKRLTRQEDHIEKVSEQSELINKRKKAFKEHGISDAFLHIALK
jgi:restriction endonuclease S subunit